MKTATAQIDHEYVIDTLKKLVSIHSVTGNEEKIALYIKNELERLGADSAQLQQVTDNTYNVIASLKGGRPGRKLLFTGHMDTVPAGDGWEYDPFSATIEGDRLYGRGALDMKSGIAAVLGMVKYAVGHKEDLPGEIKIAFVADEEAYSKGVDKLIENGLDADFGIAAEPEYNPAIIGAVGKMLIKATAAGVSAHGSQPQNGINAVEDMSRFIAALEHIPIPTHQQIPSQPFVTLKIEGGFKEYSIVVPDSCCALINKHTTPAETSEYVLEHMRGLVDELNLKSKFTFRIQAPYYPAYDVGVNLPELEDLSEIFKRVTGSELQLGYCAGVCDNNRIVPLTGVSVVCLGANGGGLHAANEWASIISVLQISEIYRQLMFKD